VTVAGKGLEIIGPKMSRSSFRAGNVVVFPLVTGASAGPSEKNIDFSPTIDSFKSPETLF
jgi:hypothetical protein